MSNLSAIHDERAEQAMLGCMVRSKGEVMDRLDITADHFFSEKYREIALAVVALHKGGQPINIHSVLSAFDSEETERLGGGFAIKDACSYPILTNVDYDFAILEEKLTLRRAYDLGQWLVENAKNGTPAADIVKAYNERGASLETSVKSDNLTVASVNDLNLRMDRIERGETVTGMETPFEAWNSAFGGIAPGNLYALAGRPGAGKNAMVEQMIAKLIQQEIPVIMFAKDMSPQMMIDRMVSRTAGVPFWKLNKRMLSENDIKRMRLVAKAFAGMEDVLRIVNPGTLTPEKLVSIMKREIRTHKIKCVFLDHFTVLSVGKDLREGLTRASITLRTAVTETNIPMVVLAHVNRTGAKGRPTTEDIKECDQLLGDSDGTAMLWTDQDRAELGPDEMLTMKLYIGKNRYGAVCENELLFDGPNMKFLDKPKEAPSFFSRSKPPVNGRR